jgi:hypothetical protein
MKLFLPLCLAAACVSAAVAPARAQYPAYAPKTLLPPPAPDACGPGYYFYDCYGTQFGPTHYVVPPWCPFQGARPPLVQIGQNGKPYLPPPQMPAPAGPAGPPSFPSHPYARSPRDFFMWREAQEDRFTREQMPRFVP